MRMRMRMRMSMKMSMIMSMMVPINHSGELKPRILTILNLSDFKWINDLANLTQSL